MAWVLCQWMYLCSVCVFISVSVIIRLKGALPRNWIFFQLYKLAALLWVWYHCHADMRDFNWLFLFSFTHPITTKSDRHWVPLYQLSLCLLRVCSQYTNYQENTRKSYALYASVPGSLHGTLEIMLFVRITIVHCGRYRVKPSACVSHHWHETPILVSKGPCHKCASF